MTPLLPEADRLQAVERFKDGTRAPWVGPVTEGKLWRLVDQVARGFHGASVQHEALTLEAQRDNHLAFTRRRDVARNLLSAHLMRDAAGGRHVCTCEYCKAAVTELDLDAQEEAEVKRRPY